MPMPAHAPVSRAAWCPGGIPAPDPSTLPQWVLDKQAKLAKRADEEAATAAAVTVARRPGSGGWAGRVLAGGPAGALLASRAAEQEGPGGLNPFGLHPRTASARRAASRGGVMGAESVAGHRVGDQQCEAEVQALLGLARDGAQHPNLQRWYTGAAAGLVFAQTLEVRACTCVVSESVFVCAYVFVCSRGGAGVERVLMASICMHLVVCTVPALLCAREL